MLSGGLKVPLDQQTRLMVPIFKKGARKVCFNYQGTTLLRLPEKVYSRVPDRKLQPVVEQIQEEQTRLCPGCRTMVQLLTLSVLLGGLWDFAQVVNMFHGLGEGLRPCPFRSTVRPWISAGEHWRNRG